MELLAFSAKKQETGIICKTAFEVLAQISDENLNCQACPDLEEFQQYWQSKSVLDVACMDISARGAVPAAEKLRSRHAQTQLMLIADITTMPTVYMKPTIMASSLLLRPVETGRACSALQEVFSALLETGDDESVYALKTQDGITRIPIREILYFEARDKRIFLRTLYEEYSFYSTIEKLSQELPDIFVQCHRSFLINKNKLQKIVLSEGIVYLQDDVVIPLSRSFRSAAKEWLKK